MKITKFDPKAIDLYFRNSTDRNSKRQFVILIAFFTRFRIANNFTHLKFLSHKFDSQTQ